MNKEIEIRKEIELEINKLRREYPNMSMESIVKLASKNVGILRINKIING